MRALGGVWATRLRLTMAIAMTTTTTTTVALGCQPTSVGVAAAVVVWGRMAGG